MDPCPTLVQLQAACTQQVWHTAFDSLERWRETATAAPASAPVKKTTRKNIYKVQQRLQWQREGIASFRGGTRGNSVPIVKVFKNALWTAFGTVSGPKALDCRILHVRSQIFAGGNTPGLPQKRLRCLDPYTNFRLARQSSHCSCFTKRPLIGILVSN